MSILYNIEPIESHNANTFERGIELSCFDKYVSEGRLINLAKGDAYKLSKNYFGYIIHGSIQIVLTNKYGTKKIVRLLGPKNLVGDTFFVLKREGYESFTAAEETSICLFDRHYYDTVLIHDQEVSQALITWIALHAETMGRQLAESLDRDPFYKIASFLFKLASDEGQRNERGNLEYTEKLSHNDIAMYVGVNRVVVTRELEKLKQGGIIAMEKGKIEIIDEKSLKAIFD